MGILFENKYIRDENTFKEVYRTVFLKRPLAIILMACAAISVVFTIVISIVIGVLQDWYYVFVWVLIFILQIVGYFRSVNLAVRRDIETFGGAPTVLITIDKDQIFLSTNGMETKVNFCEVKRARITKNYIVLISAANLMYILKKDSFIAGSFDDLVVFLKDRCIKVG